MQGGADLVAGVREGDLLAGKYRVERVLGAGGMGLVVAAEHVHLKQRVAIKFLLPAASSGESMERFLREAQAAARIRSEHVAGVLDVGTLDSGAPYMVMEFLEGRDLAQLLDGRGSLPAVEAIEYMLEACEGVAEAHAVGIVHRDLKPSNLFLCDRGGGRTVVKVLDFGISKSVSRPGLTRSDLTLTKTAAVMGSPLYMSPEQMMSAKDVDARTDIWSLGVSLFELITGKRPFEGESLTELVANVLQRPPLTMGQVIPDVPPAFDAALGGALEKEREKRYPSVAEFAAAIAPFGPRHAALAVERIARALGSSAQVPSALATTVPVAALETAGRSDPPAERARMLPGGGTTAKPVLSEIAGEHEPLPKKPFLRGATPLAGAALFLLGAGSAWWMASRGLAGGSLLPVPDAASSGATPIPAPDASAPAGTADAATADATSGSEPTSFIPDARATSNPSTPKPPGNAGTGAGPRRSTDPWERRN
jgi:tRNA A-37 threonylcarbamoyl transferase component Bud32